MIGHRRFARPHLPPTGCLCVLRVSRWRQRQRRGAPERLAGKLTLTNLIHYGSLGGSYRWKRRQVARPANATGFLLKLCSTTGSREPTPSSTGTGDKESQVCTETFHLTNVFTARIMNRVSKMRVIN